MILSSLWRRILGMSDQAKVIDALGAATAAQGAKADAAYQPSNILGTVSQSGGIPTGAILEGGSNANGTYLRLADGTQFCFASIASSASADVTWTFPVAFSLAPSQCGSGVGTGTTNVRSLTTSSVGTTSLAFRVVDATNTRVAATANILVMGRWF